MSEKEAKREYLGELEKISRNVKEEQSLELVNILNGSSPSINKKSHRKEETREEDSIEGEEEMEKNREEENSKQQQIEKQLEQQFQLERGEGKGEGEEEWKGGREVEGEEEVEGEKGIVEMQVKVVNEMESIKAKLNEDTLRMGKLEAIVSEQLGKTIHSNETRDSSKSKLNKELQTILEKLEKNLQTTSKSRSLLETNFTSDLKTLKETEEKMLSTLKSIEKSIDSWKWFTRTTAILLPIFTIGGFVFLRLSNK